MNKDYENSHAFAAKFMKEDGTIVDKLPVDAQVSVGSMTIDLTETNKKIDAIKTVVETSFAEKERQTSTLTLNAQTQALAPVGKLVQLTIECQTGTSTIKFKDGSTRVLNATDSYVNGNGTYVLNSTVEINATGLTFIEMVVV